MSRRPLPASLLAGSCLVVGAGLACAKATTHTLAPAAGAVHNGQLEVRGDARLDHKPVQGWDLVVDLGFTWRGQHRLRLDLTRTLVRIDGMPWTTCRRPPDLDSNSLFVGMEPGDVRQLSLSCLDIARPYESVELRLHASGTGGTGVVELAFSGVDGS